MALQVGAARRLFFFFLFFFLVLEWRGRKYQLSTADYVPGSSSCDGRLLVPSGSGALAVAEGLYKACHDNLFLRDFFFSPSPSFSGFDCLQTVLCNSFW